MYAKLAWEKYTDEQIKDVMAFNEDYKNFITNGKTERLCVKQSIELAKEKGFKELSEYETLKPGDKVYVNNMNKNIALFVVGKQPIETGMRILGAHIDSPRIDLKANPIYESNELAYFDTHYYGGIKKYQWVTLPLALHGVIVKKDGTKLNISDNFT